MCVCPVLLLTDVEEQRIAAGVREHRLDGEVAVAAVVDEAANVALRPQSSGVQAHGGFAHGQLPQDRLTPAAAPSHSSTLRTPPIQVLHELDPSPRLPCNQYDARTLFFASMMSRAVYSASPATIIF